MFAPVGADRELGAVLRGAWLTRNIASNPGSVSGIHRFQADRLHRRDDAELKLVDVAGSPTPG